MTVNNNPPISGPHLADGVQTEWPFDWKVFKQEHVSIVVRTADGTETDTYTTNISVANEYLKNDAGGYAKYPVTGSPVASGHLVYVVRNVPFEQSRRIGNQGGFYPEIHEDAFDELAMQIQQINEIAGRSLVVEIGDDPPDVASIYEAEANSLAAAEAAAGSAGAAADALAAVPAAATDAAEAVINPAIIAIMGLSEAAEGSAELAEGFAAAAAENAIASSPLPIGSYLFSGLDDDFVPPGYLLVNGASVTPAYPELRTKLIASGYPLDGNGDPILQDTGGRAFRGWLPGQLVDSGRVFGTVQADAMQGHWHETVLLNGAGSGARLSGDATSSGTVNTSTGVPQARGAVSDGVNGTPRIASETRMANFTGTVWIKAYSADQVVGALELAELVNDVTDQQVRLTAVEAWQGFKKYYEGAETAITLGGLITAAHGLSAVPKMVGVALRCKTAEFGYSVGDEITLPSNFDVNASSQFRGFTISQDAVNLYVRTATVAAFVVFNKSTGAGADITPANWRYVLRAWV